MDKLPVFEMVIDENPQSEVEVSFIALVDKPAIEKNFMAFADTRIFFKADSERQIISGPAMIPDTLIYRRDENGEYNVFFSKKTIEDIALKFFKKDYQKNINLFHDPNLSIEGVTVFESFISAKDRNINPMQGYEDMPDGTWFISAKVENPDVWAKIKSGEVKGFSVEGYFSTLKVQKQSIEEKVFHLLSAIRENSDHLISNEEEMAIKEKLKAALATFKKTYMDQVPPVTPPVHPTPPVNPGPNDPAKFTDYQTTDGKAISIDKLEVGGMCKIGDQPCPPGDYELSDGTKVSVGEGGVIAAVTPPAQMSAITMKDVDLAIQKALDAYKTATAATVTAQAEKIAQYETKLVSAEKAVTDQKATIKSLFELVEQIADLPTGNELPATRTRFNDEQIKSKEARLASLGERIHNLKKAQ